MSDRSFKQKRGEVCPPSARSLYVHVPLCQSKCRYCGFYSVVADEALARRYVRCALAELRLRRASLALPLETLYVGGGTPTHLPAELLERLVTEVSGLIGAESEFSVEANPASLTPEKAHLLARAGVNRVTVGAQSFDADHLRWLGRSHGPAQIGQALDAARGAGIDNLGLDLIYGIPGQGRASWRDSLWAAVDLGVSHVSCYALSYDAGTPLHGDIQAGRAQPMPDRMQEELYNTAVEMLVEAGFEHYELSNFARWARRSRHNQVYWRNEAYVGLGPSGASYVNGFRSVTCGDLGAYCDALSSGVLPAAESERLPGRAHMGETVMLGLRLIEGIDRESFGRRFGLDVVEAFPASVERHLKWGSIELTRRRLRLARSALFVADAVLADFLSEV